MAVKQVDAISSFQHIVDSVPQWRKSISELSAYATKRHEEFVAEYARALQQVKMKRPKSGSLLSIHSHDAEEMDVDQDAPQLKSPQPSELIDINPLEAGNRFIYAQARRKRRPGTSIRSNNSGPRIVRNKQMVIIYYDSHIQSELDKLVKGLGAARNTIRKGKNAYTVAKGFSLPGLSRKYDGLDSLMPSISSRSAPHLPKIKPDAKPEVVVSSPEPSFCLTDKELDQIQSLCETAAHQAIRDGDCETELRESAKKLETLLTLAQSSLDILKAEEQSDEQNPDISRKLSVDAENTSAESTLCEKPSAEALQPTAKLMPSLLKSIDAVHRPPIASTLSAPPGPIIADAIEVDDDSDDEAGEVELDLPLKLGSYRAANRGVAR